MSKENLGYSLTNVKDKLHWMDLNRQARLFKTIEIGMKTITIGRKMELNLEQKYGQLGIYREWVG